jgi:hypothetical protein
MITLPVNTGERADVGAAILSTVQISLLLELVNLNLYILAPSHIDASPLAFNTIGFELRFVPELSVYVANGVVVPAA